MLKELKPRGDAVTQDSALTVTGLFAQVLFVSSGLGDQTGETGHIKKVVNSIRLLHHEISYRSRHNANHLQSKATSTSDCHAL
jgi:hypothetical protein